MIEVKIENIKLANNKSEVLCRCILGKGRNQDELETAIIMIF